MNRDRFDPNRSVLAHDAEKLQAYVQMLECAIGNRVRVVGILEIGSFAKGEAVPTSDIDTRVYVTTPDLHLFNRFGTEAAPPQYEAFAQMHEPGPIKAYDWRTFNDPVALEISDRLSLPVEFGFVDREYAAFELSRLDQFPSIEHALLFQSHILYDPEGFLAQQRGALRGRVFQPLVEYYEEGVSSRLTKRLSRYLEPHADDVYKLEKSGQIIWVQQAVRCLRNAVAAKTYGTTGQFVYRKPGVLRFYREYLPDDFEFVDQLYTWKTDPRVRAEMVREFMDDPQRLYALFKSCLPHLETTVKKVNALESLR